MDTQRSTFTRLFRRHSSEEVRWIGVMEYYFYGLSFRQVGRNLFRDHSTVKGWWNNFVQYGTPCKTRKKLPKKLTEVELGYIKRVIDESPTIYLDEIASSLYEIYGVRISISTLCRSLYHDLNYTRKAITKFNREKSISLQRCYWTMMLQIGARQDQLVFLDESSKDVRDLARLYGR